MFPEAEEFRVCSKAPGAFSFKARIVKDSGCFIEVRARLESYAEFAGCDRKSWKITVDSVDLVADADAIDQRERAVPSPLKSVASEKRNVVRCRHDKIKT